MFYEEEDLSSPDVNLLLEYARSEQEAGPEFLCGDFGPKGDFAKKERAECERDAVYDCPASGAVRQGRVVRKRGLFFNTFHYQAEGGRAELSEALVARRLFGRWGVYRVLGEASCLVGEVHSDMLGTKYRGRLLRGGRVDEVCCVEYKKNFFGKSGPRSFGAYIDFANDPDGEMPRLSRRVRERMDETYMELKNKRPVYNAETQSYMLNFNGRVTLPSSKNFQLVSPVDVSYVTLTFGKVGEDEFVLDFSEPWCGFTAFTVAISALTFKMFCE